MVEKIKIFIYNFQREGYWFGEEYLGNISTVYAFTPLGRLGHQQPVI